MVVSQQCKYTRHPPSSVQVNHPRPSAAEGLRQPSNGSSATNNLPIDGNAKIKDEPSVFSLKRAEGKTTTKFIAFDFNFSDGG